ncbi:accessory Sec system glycosyltransferase Asp1 [Lactobacillus sp. ESL0791]|uniref:accessory Sec system glycosyltransferase Asp1 n=1 Tax=Lactobacillus sp. ESL0791 TaxID=2983234 RepID=UPI0023F9DF53|nr:accessory Sec system glycosyltransferase Asp1 [Lactobacillus sp. ESL0791]MDF7638661.1 accessory Sec system glycosyltransferase Asp1 [Lactobacillus sp. ESL0791]
MYYFLNNRLDENSSGIEHAEVKRLKLFKQFGVPAQLAMCQFNRFAHRTLPLYGLTDDDYINVFDYFAGTRNFIPQEITVEDLPLPDDIKIVETDEGDEIYYESRKIMLVQTFADSEQVDYIKYFNADNHCTKQDFYDTRGFNSFTQFYDTGNNHLVAEQFYRPDGSIYYEIAYEQRTKDLAATNIQLTDLDGLKYSLMNNGQAFTMMLDHLNQEDMDRGEQSTFISDRSNITNLPMLNMKTPARKIEHFHNIHFRDYWDPMNSPLTYPSISQTDQLSKTDLVVTPSTQQAKDMRKRLRTQVPIVAIPVGVVPDEQLKAARVPFTQRIYGKIIVVARLFHEKRLDDAIKAFNLAYQKNRNLSMDIYGYGDSSDDYREEKMLQKLVEDLDLEDVVQFMGYTQDIGSAYDESQLMVMSSRYEGFNMSILEAQSHGVPVVSYDINYGPKDIIQDQKDGFLVPSGDIDQLSQHINDFFHDADMRERMSAAAYENAKRFSPANVWQYWQKYVINPEK